MSLHKYKQPSLYDKHVAELSNDDLKAEIKNVKQSTPPKKVVKILDNETHE